MTPILLALAALLAYLAWDLSRSAARLAQRTGVEGSVLYSDADHLRPAEPLRAEIGNGVVLVGKPDYVLVRDGHHVPLEYKSGKSPKKDLYPNYAAQVAVYFILIESHYGAPPPYGIVRFADGREFRVENTPAARQDVIDRAVRLAAIRRGDQAAARNHNQAWKCRACEFAPVCETRL